jgi:hypothetical protein
MEAKHLRHRVDPEGAEDAFARARARRRLKLAELPDGMVVLDGLLDPESGAVLRHTLDRLMPPPRKGDDRTTTQRRHDALVDMARRWAPVWTSPRRPPLLANTHTTTLRGEPGAPGAEVARIVLPASVAQRMACDAKLVEIEVDENDQPIAVAPARRTVQPATWRALVRRDKGCVLCGAPPEDCEAHDRSGRPWDLDHRPTLDERVLLCLACHREEHAKHARRRHQGDDGCELDDGGTGPPAAKVDDTGTGPPADEGDDTGTGLPADEGDDTGTGLPAAEGDGTGTGPPASEADDTDTGPPAPDP